MSVTIRLKAKLVLRTYVENGRWSNPSIERLHQNPHFPHLNPLHHMTLLPRSHPPSVYVQPIISKARADLLKSHFLPTLDKLKKKTVKVVGEEELLKADSKGDTQEAELLILDEFAVLCRDLYAFYPMLIRYVDNNRWACCMMGSAVSFRFSGRNWNRVIVDIFE